jgi:hypothetical protein
VPAAWGGVTHSIRVGEMNSSGAQGAPPIKAAVEVVKDWPNKMTTVPPDVGPLVGAAEFRMMLTEMTNSPSSSSSAALPQARKGSKSTKDNNLRK